MRKWFNKISPILLFLSGPALGQDLSMLQMQYRNDPVPALPADGESLRLMYTAGMCIARTRDLASALNALPDSQPEGRILFWSAVYGPSRCFEKGGKTILAPRYLRGIVAEYYLTQHIDLQNGTVKKQLLKVFKMPESSKFESLPAETRVTLALIEVGSCVARANPKDVARLFAASIVSEEERAVFRDLVPSISSCVPQGVDFKVSKLQIRGYLAEGAYRNAVAAQAERK